MTGWPLLGVLGTEFAERRVAGQVLIGVLDDRVVRRADPFQEFVPGDPLRQAARHDGTNQRLGFHDRHVRLATDGEEVVDDAARCPLRTGVTPMVRHGDLMDDAAPLHGERTGAATDQRPRLHRSAQGGDHHEFAVLDAKFPGEFRRKLHEKLRLEFVEVGQETAHRARGVMLGEAVGREDVRKSRVIRPEKRLSGRLNQLTPGLVSRGYIWLCSGDSNGS